MATRIFEPSDAWKRDHSDRTGYVAGRISLGISLGRLIVTGTKFIGHSREGLATRQLSRCSA
jgi:hypothetical protein